MPIVEIKELRSKIPPRTRILGMDHSKSRIGLALASLETGVVTPFKVLTGKNFTENLSLLTPLCKEYGVTTFIIGLPLNMDGTRGPRAESVLHFADNLIRVKDKLGFEPLIAFFDESLTSHAADDLMEGKNRDMQDAQAAAIILQDALKAMAAVS